MQNYKKIKVGVLGATGMVGQNYLNLLINHPWFEVSCMAASERSAGKNYGQILANKNFLNISVPEHIFQMNILDAQNYREVISKCDLVFSAIEMESKKDIQDLEIIYAKNGVGVISNSSAHRWTDTVPVIIPEINSEHLKIIEFQKSQFGFEKGFIVTKPNCSLQSYLTPIYALHLAGYPINEIMVTLMQAVSGAGHPGVSSLDIIDNIIPFINGEEEKTQREPLKILGKIDDGKFLMNQEIKISAQCNRVPVIDGHLACVSIKYKDKKPSHSEVLKIWNEFFSDPQRLKLPLAPHKPIQYLFEEARPQPKKDRMLDKGMTVSVGRLRNCNVLDDKFVSLSHNIIRGAAGGGVLTAELVVSKGYLN